VDEFHGDNEGLVVAEIELDDENEIFEKPDWLDDEVTSDYRYLNSNLSKSSYKTW
jgi:CYTH domain-containing protein